MAPSTHRLALLLALLVAPAIEAAALRLGSEIIPILYRLDVRPDLRRETFVVDETIRVRVTERISTITLHAAELEVEKATVHSSGGRQRPTVELDEDAQLIRLHLTEPIEPGEAEIRLSVRGRMGRTLRGLYVSEANGRRYAFTQLQPADARRFFACFDEPALKAQFDLIVAVDARSSAISNGRIISTLPGIMPGTKRIRFERTPPMSTYMLALAFGEFDCLTERSGGVQIRLCAQPEKVALGKYALVSAKKSFEFFEDYTGIDYPFEKLDLVVLPDFSPGGMENPGAVFLREGAALINPEKAPLETRRWVASLVGHEIAHMWVGNLVTARWWSDLWLNEGIATWLARKALIATQPELEPETAAAFSMLKALEADSLEGSRATRSEVDDPATVIELFDLITNDKPAAVISMVESLAGADAMRRGLREYLVTWSWGAASTDDFLASIEPELGSAGVATIRDFVTRPGYPKIDVSSRCLDGRLRVTVSQRPVRESLRASGPWTIPFCIRAAAGGSVTCATLRGEPAELDAGVCGGDIVVNPGFIGFYRAAYERGVVLRILARHGDTLAVNEKLMLLDSEWSSFRSGERPVGDVLDTANAVLSSERSAAVVAHVAMQLGSIQDTVSDERELSEYRSWVAHAARSRERRGEETGSDDASVRLESELAWIGGVIGDDAALRARSVSFAKDYLRDPWKERKTSVDVMLATAARTGDEALYDAMAERMRKTRNDQERYRLVFALAFFPAPALVDRTLRMTIDGTVRSQDAAALIARLLSRRDSSARAWEFVREEWPAIRKTLPPGFTSDRIVRAAGSFCDAERRKEVESFFSSPEAPAAPRALASSLASIDACIAMRERHRGEIGEWLAARNAAR